MIIRNDDVPRDRLARLLHALDTIEAAVSGMRQVLLAGEAEREIQTRAAVAARIAASDRDGHK